MAAELVGLGFATLDHLMVVESFDAPVGQMKVKAFDVQGGGMTATALVTASRLGVTTELWSTVGGGPLGDWIVAGLEEEGVGLECLRRRDDADGPLILVFVDERTGERRFQMGRLFKTEGPYPLELQRLDGAACLLVDGIWSQAALEAARYAKEHGVPVVADFGGVEGKHRDLLPYVDYLVANEACAERVARGDDPERACRLMREMGPSVVVVTLGDRGCTYADDAGVRRLPAFTVDVADTTGAGDCFHGAFCVGVLRGWDLDRTVEFASAVAAIKCRKLGGRAGLPGMAEVETFLKERKA